PRERFETRGLDLLDCGVDAVNVGYAPDGQNRPIRWVDRVHLGACGPDCHRAVSGYRVVRVLRGARGEELHGEAGAVQPGRFVDELPVIAADIRGVVCLESIA